MAPVEVPDENLHKFTLFMSILVAGTLLAPYQIILSVGSGFLQAYAMLWNINSSTRINLAFVSIIFGKQRFILPFIEVAYSKGFISLRNSTIISLLVDILTVPFVTIMIPTIFIVLWRSPAYLQAIPLPFAFLIQLNILQRIVAKSQRDK